MDGLVLRGRLVKVVEPETYQRKDGTERTSYPFLVVLAGDETVKVEYRTVEARDDALIGGCESIGAGPSADGMVPGLPEVELVVRALGQWDSETRSFGAVRLAGAS